MVSFNSRGSEPSKPAWPVTFRPLRPSSSYVYLAQPANVVRMAKIHNMLEFARLERATAVKFVPLAYKWQDVDTVVDIGGGTGAIWPSHLSKSSSIGLLYSRKVTSSVPPKQCPSDRTSLLTAVRVIHCPNSTSQMPFPRLSLSYPPSFSRFPPCSFSFVDSCSTRRRTRYSSLRTSCAAMRADSLPLKQYLPTTTGFDRSWSDEEVHSDTVNDKREEGGAF